MQEKSTLFFENMQEKRKYLIINNIHRINIPHKIKSVYKYAHAYISLDYKQVTYILYIYRYARLVPWSAE